MVFNLDGVNMVNDLSLQEGAQIIGDQDLEKTRGQTGEKNMTTSPISPKVKRQTTVGATVEVKTHINWCALFKILIGQRYSAA